MPLTPAFTVSQSLADPSTITVTDTSTGSDAAITSRRVYIRLANGTYLVVDGTTTDYEVWAIADTAITLELLPRSEALQIIVQWLDVSNEVIYTATEYTVFTWADYIFLYQLTQTQAGRPKLRDNRNYYYSKIRMFVNVEDAENAVDYASDIWNSQESLDDNYYLMNNQQLFF
jgi:hypothetical protein